ncbi:MAG: hypothetical protein LIO96_06065 [Lachnospiraceae bacterium]|nr:hypothetical protein [Lachnospiraceae bacterium]
MAVTFLMGALMLVCCTLFLLAVRNGIQARQLSGELCSLMLRQISPNLSREVAE